MDCGQFDTDEAQPLLASRCLHRTVDPRIGAGLESSALPAIEFCGDCVLRWVVYAVDKMSMESYDTYLDWFEIEGGVDSSSLPHRKPLHIHFTDAFTQREQEFENEGWKLDVTNQMLRYESVYGLASIHSWLRMGMPQVPWPDLEDVPGPDNVDTCDIDQYNLALEDGILGSPSLSEIELANTEDPLGLDAETHMPDLEFDCSANPHFDASDFDLGDYEMPGGILGEMSGEVPEEMPPATQCDYL